MAKDTGKVNIHGKEYETVASRVKKLRNDHGLAIGITTEIVSIDEDVVVMKAILTQDGIVVATGHAEEKRAASTINRTSALENCETSAIGRALAAAGYLGTEFATADEVAQAISQQNELVPVKKDEPITVKQIQLLGSKLKWAYMAVKEYVDNDAIINELTTILGKDADKVMKSEMDEAIAKVEERVAEIKSAPKDEPTEDMLEGIPY
jgi:hypothetical protein